MARKPVAPMLAKEWAAMKYGEFAPTPYALRCWIAHGYIQPPPKYIQGKWLVLPTAEYRDSLSDQRS